MSRYIFVLIIIFVLLGAGSGLCHFHSSKDNSSKKTLKLSSLFLNGDFSSFEKSLGKLPKDKQSICKNLLEGVRLQSQKKFDESELLLEKVFIELRLHKTDNSDFALMEELLGARFLNSFLQKKYEKLKQDLKNFEHHLPLSSTLNLLKSIFFYSQKEFHTSLNFLLKWEQKDTPKSRISEHNWLSSNLETLFIKHHLPLLKAHCLIETGELNKGKNYLNVHFEYLLEWGENWNPEYYQQLSLLLSRYHHLFAKNCSSQQEKFIHYEMMIFYLNKAEKIDRKSLKTLINRNDLLLIIQELFSEMTDLNINILLSFIEFTEKNYNHLKYNEIIEKMHESHEKENHHILLVKCLKAITQNPTIQKFKNQLIKNLSNYMRMSLEKLDIRKIRQYFTYLEILEPEISFTQRIMISTEDMQKILLCGVSEEQLKTYLSLWAKETTSVGEQNHLLLSLVEGVKSLWRQRRDNDALNILKIILSTTSYNKEVEKKILKFIKTAYQNAESMQNISRLCLLDEFVFNHQLPLLMHINPENIANLIADAEYFYVQQDYGKALIYCNWLAKVSPDNPAITKLTGLCLLEQRNYKEALSYLEKISYEKQDKHIHHALEICMEELSLKEL